MIPVRGYAGHRVAVLGLGRSGRPAVAALRPAAPRSSPGTTAGRARARAEADGIALADLTRAGAWEGVKALIVSPGIPHLYPAPHPAVAAAWDAGVAVDNDIGLFFRSFATPAWDAFDRPPQVVAITGSNGKSTTTALLAHVLAAAAGRCRPAATSAAACSTSTRPADGMVVVLELSSYQIELARALQPDIAVFLNLSPDHLDRHGGMGGYFAAKRRLFTQGGPSRSIIGVDENEGRFLANAMREEAGTGDPVITVSVTRKLGGPGWSVFARKGFLAEWRGGRQVASIDLRAMPTLPGAHNHQNACAAYAAARSLGMAPRQIEALLALLPGLAAPQPARRHLEGASASSTTRKATNADAAEKRARLLRAHPLDRRRPAEGGRDRGAAVAFPTRSEGLPDRRGGGGVRGDARGDAARGVGDARGGGEQYVALPLRLDYEYVLLSRCATWRSFRSLVQVRARLDGLA